MDINTPITITEPQNNHFLLSGKLSLDNLMAAREAFDDRRMSTREPSKEPSREPSKEPSKEPSEEPSEEPAEGKETEVRVDLSQLEVEGFAVLALLVHIQRAVQASGGSVSFNHPSTGLVQLATIGRLVDILSFEPPL